MSENIKELVQTGKRYFESRNFARAEQCLLKVLRADSRYADVLNMLGVIYHAEGKFNDAVKCFQEALKINPNYTEASLNLAVLHNDLGEYAQAKRLYQRIHGGKKVDPRVTDPKVNPVMRGKIANMHAAIADTYFGIGCLSDAIEEYKKALALCPDYKDIQTKLGVSYRENNQKQLSAKELVQAVKAHPHYLPARIQLGLTYYSQGEKQKAVREWQSVLKRDKENPLAKMYLRISEK